VTRLKNGVEWKVQNPLTNYTSSSDIDVPRRKEGKEKVRWETGEGAKKKKRKENGWDARRRKQKWHQPSFIIDLHLGRLGCANLLGRMLISNGI